MSVKRNLRRVYRWLAALFATVVIVVALLVSLFRVVVPHVPEYRNEIVAWSSGVFGAPVTIDSLDLQWRGLRPEVVLKRVSFVTADARGAVAAAEVRLGISLRALVRYGRFAPATITLVEPDMTIVLEERYAAATGQEWQRAFSSGEHRGELEIVRGRVTLLADAGRRRAEFRALDLLVSSDGLNHEIRATGRLHDDLEGMLHIAGEARGWPGEANFSAEVRAEARRVGLVGVQQLGRVGRLEAGQVDAVIDLRVDRGEAQHLRLDFGLSGLRWQSASGPMRVDRAAGELMWQRTGSGWEAGLHRLDVARGTGTRTSGPLVVAFTAPVVEKASAQWQVTAGRLEVADIALLAEAFPWNPAGGLENLLHRNPGGVIEGAMVAVERPLTGPARYHLQLDAVGLTLDAGGEGPVPGFRGLSARVQGDQDGGEAALGIADGAVMLPRVFRAPIGVTEAQARLQWARTEGRWEITAREVSLWNADARVVADVGWHLESGGGMLAVDAVVSDARLDAKSGYLPITVLSPNLVAWLDRAVVGGQVPQGQVRVRVPLGESALVHERELAVDFEVENLVLDYADDWPRVEQAQARVHFDGEGFHAEVASAQYAGAPVLGGTVVIPSFRALVLEVDARAGDELGAMFDGLRRTPVGRAEWLGSARASGSAILDLKLSIDLGHTRPVDVDGQVTVNDASFGVGGFEHALENLDGIVTISRDGFGAEGVRGRLLGEPVGVTARTLRDGEGIARAVEVDLDGHLDRAMLGRLVVNDELPLSGRTAWQATVLAPYASIQAPILRIESDLLGLDISLPDPVGKAAAQRTPMSLQLELGGERRRLVVESDDRVRVDATLEAGADGWGITRGRVHLGPGTPGPVPAKDVAVTGTIAYWQLAVGGVAPRVAATALTLSAVALEVGQFTAWGHDLGAVTLQGNRSELGWYWMLDGARISGNIDLPDAPTNQRPVRVAFERLDIPVAERVRPDVPTHADPRTLPPIAFHTGDFRIGAMHLGEVNGFVRPVTNGVTLDGFTATRAEMRMSVDASWHTVDGLHRTVVRGTLESTDVQPTLAALGYVASIDAAAGHLQVDVDWMDSPLSNPLHTLNGTLSVRMERGTLHDLQPGAGRIFGLLSLYALPRRLALDFSDVFQRGLAFDSIQGQFDIRDGSAYTEDLTLSGPAARVEISGRTGLSARDYDQEAVVTGSLGSSLTLAGALVGGPAVGAAMLVMSAILKRPLEDMARVRYHLTGPWDNPSVERMQEAPRD